MMEKNWIDDWMDNAVWDPEKGEWVMKKNLKISELMKIIIIHIKNKVS